MDVATKDEMIFVMCGSEKETKTKLFANTARRRSATSKMRSCLACQQHNKCCEQKSFSKRSLPQKRQRAEEIRHIVNTELNKD